jgi:ABC-type nitrate/sulfonate/bicarbonate transport system ATPase subunit
MTQRISTAFEHASSARPATDGAAIRPADEPLAVSLFDVGLSYRTGETARLILRDITFNIAERSFVSIIGPSGSGKTTLLRLLAGLIMPTVGQVRCYANAVTRPSRERAIVFQDYGKALLPWRTVWHNVALAYESRGLARAEQRERSYALLRQMRIEDVGELYPGQLSGGMQQRVQIARCLAQEPRLLLMDEPFGALDAMTRQTLQDEVAQLVAERGVTVVFVTHDLDEAIYLGDRVIALTSDPGTIAESVAIDLPRPRDQLTTRASPEFLAHRQRLFLLLQERKR